MKLGKWVGLVIGLLALYCCLSIFNQALSEINISPTHSPTPTPTWDWFTQLPKSETPTSPIAISSTPTFAFTTPVKTLTSPTVTPSVEVSQGIKQVSASNELISRTYKWSYNNSEWTWSLQLSKALYDYYRDIPRPSTRNYSIYVTHPLDDGYVNQLAAKILESAKLKGFNEFQTVSYAAAFVQSLPYTEDSVTTNHDEYPRYPIETLVDNGGDCEDTAILMASLLRAMDYGVVLLRFKLVESGHLAVGVLGGEGIYGTYWNYNGGKYYYLETTGDDWEIGQIPDEYKNLSASVFDMKPVPIITHSWTTRGMKTYLELQVKVNNLGTAPASGVYVYAGFDAGDNKCWNSQTSQPFQLEADTSVTVTLTLQPPLNKYTRILVQTVYNGYSAYQSHSEWYDTSG